MISVNFFFISYIFLLSYSYIEIFFSILYNSIFKHTKSYSMLFSKKINYYIFKNHIFDIFINLFILFLLTLKITYVQYSVLSAIFIYIIVIKILSKYLNYNISFINFNITVLLFFFFFIKTLISFFILMELYSIIFYFFYLNTISENKNISLLQYKNMLILYLLNNFFITLLFLIGLLSIIETCGTTNFLELSFLNPIHFSYQSYFIILSLCFKLALPGLHFLKLEIYKYLNLNFVIIFSVITIFINYFIVIYIFNFNFMYTLLNCYKIPTIMLGISLFFFIYKLKINNFNEFIAYSGFATNNLILLNFLLKFVIFI